MQNLIYALIQVIHNFGAAAIVGIGAYETWLVRGSPERRFASLLAIVWALQASSGVFFGIVTYYYDGQLPDIHGVAVDALVIKIICAVLGFVLAVSYAKWGSSWSAQKCHFFWGASFALGAVALSAAAFLRWFS
ncbi:MAG: CPBP family glutamic-type intramembrane protease [Rhodomicrobium sp.]